MFGVSIPELLIVLGIVLVALGPERLPGAARSLGKALAFFRKNSDAVRKEVYNAIYTPADELTREFKDSARELEAVKKDLFRDLASTPKELLTCEDKQKLEELQKEEAEKDNSSPAPADSELEKEPSSS